MDLISIIDSIAPWLGGGAVTAAAGYTIWLWLRYHQRDDAQWDRNEQLLAAMTTDRDYWREMALLRQREIDNLKELVKEIRRRNDELERQNTLLETELDILRQRLKEAK